MLSETIIFLRLNKPALNSPDGPLPVNRLLTVYLVLFCWQRRILFLCL